MRSKMELDNKIDVFVSKYSSNAKQRSEEWYKLTKTTIGGSEVSTILGLNKYKTIYDLAKEKVGLAPGFTGNMATRWGTLFEDIIARYIELDCGTSVKGAELTIQEIPGIRYSPDGYAVVKIHHCKETNTITLITRDMPCFTKTEADDRCKECEYIVVLVEIKCPRTRKPMAGEIPEHYKPQLLSGLTFSPITKMALFTEAVIKRASLNNILEKESLAWGMIGVYSTRPLGDLVSNAVIETPIGKVFDLGKSLLKDLEDYLRRMCDGELHFEYTDPLLEEESEGMTLDPLFEDLKNRTPQGQHLIAVLPWTINEVHYTFMERDPNFLNKLIGPVKEFADLMIKLKEDPEYIDKLMDEQAKEMEDEYSSLFVR